MLPVIMRFHVIMLLAIMRLHVSMSPAIIGLPVPVYHLLSLGLMCQHITCYHEASCVSIITCCNDAPCDSISPTVMRLHVSVFHMLS